MGLQFEIRSPRVGSQAEQDRPFALPQRRPKFAEIEIAGDAETRRDAAASRNYCLGVTRRFEHNLRDCLTSYFVLRTAPVAPRRCNHAMPTGTSGDPVMVNQLMMK